MSNFVKATVSRMTNFNLHRWQIHWERILCFSRSQNRRRWHSSQSLIQCFFVVNNTTESLIPHMVLKPLTGLMIHQQFISDNAAESANKLENSLPVVRSHAGKKLWPLSVCTPLLVTQAFNIHAPKARRCFILLHFCQNWSWLIKHAHLEEAVTRCSVTWDGGRGSRRDGLCSETVCQTDSWCAQLRDADRFSLYSCFLDSSAALPLFSVCVCVCVCDV